jgi:hypothetical protein
MDQAPHMRTYFVKAVWDDDAKVWYVSHTDVPGLAVEADSPEELVKLLNTLIPELIELNDKDGGSVPYSLMLDHLTAGRAVA